MTYNPKLELTRTLGFEIECFGDVPTYTDSWGDTYADYDDITAPHCSDTTDDGSLHGGCGDGFEIKTEPIKNINYIEDTFRHLHNEYSMNVNATCGLHIHVDTSDFTIQDKAKLLRFGAGIELLMYSLVERERYFGRGMHSTHNDYCEKLHKGWRLLFRRSFVNQNFPWETFSSLGRLTDYVRRNSSHRHHNIWNGRYQWLNADVEGYPTCEFRIFSATENYELAQKYGMLAYHIIETAKNSTIEQIKFIIKSIYQTSSIDEMLTRFFDSIGLDQEFRLEVQNGELATYIDNKFCRPNRENVASEEAV